MSEPKSIFKRLLSRFSKYTIVGLTTFLLDMCILLALTKLTPTPYIVAVALGFLIGASINFLISYYWVYKGTKRRMDHGYIFFICLAITGAFLISVSTAWLVETIGLSLLFARILVGGVAGTANFLINTFFNFRLL